MPNFNPFAPESIFKHDMPERTGVLLINLGTPDAATPEAVKPYLRQFLSDHRVVELPGWLWSPILHGIILNTRPKKSAAKYASIWTADGSPLRVYTEKLAKQVKGWLGGYQNVQVNVEYAMRYGNPDIGSALERLRAVNVTRLLVVPLYPQYASSSTASALDGLFSALTQRRVMPELRILRHFHDDAGYIEALAHKTRRFWQENGRGEHLVMSFHGVPQFSIERGDPYFCECHKTARMLGEALGIDKSNYSVSFQSRFGRTEWIKPYTTAVLKDLGKKKLRKLDVICPGFVADCLETLEEIAIEGRAEFAAAGGGDLRYIPALNDDEGWVRALSTLIRNNLQGWPVTPTEGAECQARKQRALALGAKD